MGAVVEVAVGILVDETGRVLLGLRSPQKAAWPNCWDAIGGRLETGESPALALARELEEEIGILPTITKFLGSSDEPSTGGNSLLRRHIFAVAEWLGGDPKNVCDEHTELRWFSNSDMNLEENLAFNSIIGDAGRAVAFSRSRRS
ncbi:MAG: NUDIX domain-containing protein [Acidobacteria bacterium]|nr:NUDIX domain-containing protein [Acidobacteriota bacterium]